ncbi:hypothetical protein GCM10025782_24230 [Pedococcus ginsenosidimutans]|uniref:Glycosyltransferase RgtA/B/C/D-like domain-containing protein n=1 Tax=Pedococcus ginsenosidimutans TaxID=490570 RepID=A0ABP8YEA8_9MICO
MSTAGPAAASPAPARPAGTRPGTREADPLTPTATRGTRLSGALERFTVGLLVVTVVGFGAWTLAYQLALVVGLPATPTLLLAVVVAATVSWFVLPAAVGSTGERPSRANALQALVALALGVVCAVLGGAGNQRGWMMVLLVLAGVAWVALAARRRLRLSSRPEGDAVPAARARSLPGPDRSARGALWLTAWVWALVCAVVAMRYARPDGDDAYFVNLSQWVADRGTFPLKDTMLGDQVFPALSSHSPPIHSFEGLLGALGHVTGLSAGVVTYLVATPLLTMVCVLAMAWLVSLSRIRFAPLALSAAILFMLASGEASASQGNFFALRMWQGKAALASLFLPLLVAVAVAYVARGGRRRQLVLALAVVCTVGASNTAVFLVPVMVAGLALGAWLHAGTRRALGVAVTLAYPLLCGVAVKLVAPPSSGATDPESAAAWVLPPLQGVIGQHGFFVVSIVAVAAGWAGLRSSAARAVLVSVVLATSIAMLPPVTHVLVDAASLRAVVWRVWWVVPVPLLVAGLVGTFAELAHRRLPRVLVPLTALAAAVAVVLIPFYGGRWIWSPVNLAYPVSPTAWKVPPHAEGEAKAALRVSRDGDTVLAPWDSSRVLAALSVDVHPVSARAIYLGAYAGTPSAHVEQRIELQRFADGRNSTAATIRPLVDVLGVDTACVSAKRAKAVKVLQEVGFHVATKEGRLVCLRR